MTVELICGDCIQEMQKLPDNSIDSIITDPPYGIDYQSARRTDKTQWKPKIDNDKEPFLDWIPEAFRIIKDTGSLLCFCRWDIEQQFKEAITNSGFEIKSQIIWDKVIHGMGDLDSSFAPQHENIIFATKGNFEFPRKRPQSIIRVQRVQAEKMVHPNEKPVLLFYKLIDAVMPKNGTMLDCFFGSGNSSLAANLFGINYIGYDSNPLYYETAKKKLLDAQQQMRLGI